MDNQARRAPTAIPRPADCVGCADYLRALIHLFRNRADLTSSAKAVWAIFLLILPFIGLLGYTMIRPADSQIARPH